MWSKPGTMSGAPGRARRGASVEIEPSTSDAPVDCFAEQRVGVTDLREILGMPDEQQVARPLQLGVATEERTLCVLVEVDDDVAAEDGVERALHRQRVHEIQLAE